MSSQVAMAALSILTVKLVAVGLSKELAGNYHSAYSYLQIWGILADFGLYAVAVKEVSVAKNPERVLGTFLLLRSGIVLLALGAALVIAWGIPLWRGTPLPLGISIAALVPFFTLLAGVFRVVFQVRHAMQWVFSAEVISRIVTAICMLLLVLYGELRSTRTTDYYLFLGVGSLGAVALFITSYVGARGIIRIVPHTDFTEVRRVLALAIPYGIAFLFTAIYRQSDVTLIALLRTDYELQNAEYGFALRAAEMAFLIPTYLLNATLPVLGALGTKSQQGKKLLGKTLFALLALGGSLALGSAILARPLMQLLTTEDYLSSPLAAGSDTALALLAVPMFFNAIVQYCFYVLLMEHVWQPLVRSLGIGAALATLANLYMVPRFGFVGACITSIAVHSILVVLLFPGTASRFPVILPLWTVGKLCIFFLLITAFLLVVRPWMSSTLSTLLLLFPLGASAVLSFQKTGCSAYLRSNGRDRNGMEDVIE